MDFFVTLEQKLVAKVTFCHKLLFERMKLHIMFRRNWESCRVQT